jgi:hypothetical protein
MPNEKDMEVAALEKVAQAPMEGTARQAETRSGTDRVLGGLERIREILLGDILVEIERRLARIDSQLSNRTRELQQDARHRTDVLEAHVRKEVDALSMRVGQDNREVNDAIRSLRGDLRDSMAQIEQRIARIEDRLEASITRVEREARQQLLDQAKSFLNELERVRHQLRSALVRELGLEPAPLEPAPLEEGGEHDPGAWTTSH